MVAGMLTKSSDIMLRRELLNLSGSPALAKSLYLPSARVCFRRNNNTMFLSSSGVNHTLVLSAPRHKLDNVIISNNNIITSSCFFDSCSSSFENKINPFIVNSHNSVITVSDKIVEIKNKVFKMLASLLFGFLAFMTTPRRKSLQVVSALAATSSSCNSSSSTLSPSSSVLTSCTNCNCTTLIQSHRTTLSSSTSTSSSLTCINCNCNITRTQSYRTTSSSYISSSPTSTLSSLSPSSVSTSFTNCICTTSTQSSSISTSNCLTLLVDEIVVYSTVLALLLSFLAIPLVMLVVYFKITLILVKISFIALALCIMVPPVVALVNGLLYFLQLCKDDKKSLLVLQVGVLDKTRELQIELAQIADTSNLDGMKLEGVMKSLLQRYNSCHFANLNVTQCISDEETQYGEDNDEMPSIWDNDPLVYYKTLKCVIKKLVVIIHWALKTIKKVNYDGKYSKQLFREVLTRELVRYDRDKETFSNVNGMKYEKTVGGEHGMVDNNYVVVTMLVLASVIYPAPPLVFHTKYIKTVLQKFNTIPKSKVESVEVLWSPQTEDEVVSKQKLQKDFPQLKPVDFSGFKEPAIVS